jgi:hypothetical protein
MTKAEFLCLAAKHTLWTPRPIARVPDDWWLEFEQVWARHLDVLGDICRDVSKLGGVLGVGGPVEYSRTLTAEKQVGLFREVRPY